MSQKRKVIPKEKQFSFYKEYNFEIRVILLFTLGIFLLVEDLEIKNYIYIFISKTLTIIGDAAVWMRDFIIFLVKQFEVSDIVGITLILYVFYLIINRWRDRTIERYSKLINCSKCGGDLHRIRKTYNHKMMSIIYFITVKHYQCKSCPNKEIKLVR
ncbi:MAG: hypothetical protein CMG60_00595 [Candidatus Marinimicrobia bacterium]|nr:hypothetical protein [Candidatus Neomarinimicrobiota bacterium]|tara:strand:- start:465 stop:935 length:471 start_codon:yes stop_codon:yes gene_type:complete